MRSDFLKYLKNSVAGGDYSERGKIRIFDAVL